MHISLNNHLAAVAPIENLRYFNLLLKDSLDLGSQTSYRDYPHKLNI